MTIEEFNDVPISIYNQGQCFGELEVYKNTPRVFSCTSLTNVKLMLLDKKKFKYLFFKAFPKVGKMFINRMESKFQKLEKIINKVLPLVTFRSKIIFISK